MAIAIPESISAFENATTGEKRLFKILKELLPDDYIIWYDLRVNERHPDFTILGPDLGLLVLEVKDWKINTIKKADSNNFELKSFGTKINPSKQARTYLFAIVDELKKDSKLTQTTGKYKGYLKFPFAHGVVFSGISRASFSNSPFKDTINNNTILFQDDLKKIEEEQNSNYLIKIISSMFATKFDFSPLSSEIIDRIRGTLFKEVKLDSESVFKVMNINQEQYAKSLSYGHRVIRGVAGSGKTIILTCRAKYLAETHKDWNILVLCYNKTLAGVLRETINGSNENETIEISHFHGWVNKIFGNIGLQTGLYKDGDITENLSKITEDILNKEIKYDAILIDEGQDFAPDWLKFIVKMLRDPGNSHLLLALDGAQNVYSRKYTLKSVGIKAQGRTVVMRENYRNTKEILDFAHYMLMDDCNFSDNKDDNDFIISPEASLRSGAIPELIKCETFQEELNTIMEKIIYIHKTGSKLENICILYPYRQMKILKQVFKEKNIPYHSINSKSDLNSNIDSVKISTIHSSKGLDFKYVFIVGINEGMTKYGYHESKKLLYVGMTRAREYLCITYSTIDQITDSLEKVYSKINESKFTQQNIVQNLQNTSDCSTVINSEDENNYKEKANHANKPKNGLISKIKSFLINQ